MSTRPNVVLGVVAGLVVALGLVAALVSGARAPQDLDPGTPEGTVQLFVAAVFDGNHEAAADYLAPALECDPPFQDLYLPTGVRLDVARTDVEDDRAVVLVDVMERSGGLVPQEWSYRQRYELEPAGDGWLITSDPWPVYSCETGW